MKNGCFSFLEIQSAIRKIQKPTIAGIRALRLVSSGQTAVNTIDQNPRGFLVITDDTDLPSVVAHSPIASNIGKRVQEFLFAGVFFIPTLRLSRNLTLGEVKNTSPSTDPIKAVGVSCFFRTESSGSHPGVFG